MRYALITIDNAPDLAGRALALRQLDFALAAGAERVIGVGNGASPQMIALRHAAEGAGVRFHGVAGAHGLLGAVGTADELLVLAPGLLAESSEALQMLAGGPVVLTLPALAGTSAGFERIDQDRAWAGALLMPGGLVERLSQLPSDFAAASALLRIALQARVPPRAVQPEMAAAGWCMVGDDAAGQGAAWLKRHDEPALRGDLVGGAVRLAMHRFGLSLLRQDRAQAALLAGFALTILLAVGLAAWGLAAGALAMLALAVFPARLHGALARLHRLPFHGEARTIGLLSWLLDAGLFAVLVLASGATSPEHIFAPAVLVLAARLATPARWPRLTAWLPDRMVLAVLLAISAAASVLHIGVMALSVALMAGQLCWRTAKTAIPVS